MWKRKKDVLTDRESGEGALSGGGVLNDQKIEK